MCNLYDIGPASAKQGRGWRRLVIEAMQKLPKVYGIRKTDPGLVVRRNDATGDLCPEIRHWGFHRPFNPAINNARIEKLDSGMWKPAWEAARRCVIPVATFYEWSGAKGHKQTHAFQSETRLGDAIDSSRASESGPGPAEREWLWMAGLWEDDPEHGPRYTMLTTAAEGMVAEIHDRMPAILRKNQVEAFLTLSGKVSVAEWLDGHPLSAPLEEFRCLNPLKSADPGPPIEDGFLF